MTQVTFTSSIIWTADNFSILQWLILWLFEVSCGKTPCPNVVRWFGDHNKDLLSRNCMLEMRPCSAMDRQITSDWGWKSSKITEVFWKKLYFVPIYSRCWNVWPLTLIHGLQWCSRDWCVCSKMPGCCLMVAAASVIREIRSSSESISHCHLQWLPDWLGQANGLACQVTRPHTNGLLPMGPHWSSDLHVANWFWRGSCCLYCLGSSKHQTTLWLFQVHMSVSAAFLSALYQGWWLYILTSALIWYKIQLSPPRILKLVLLDFQP